MTLTPQRWWSDPRPRRFLSNPIDVSAVEYDASPSAQSAIRRWVHRGAITNPATVRIVEQAVLIIEQPGADPVCVHPGEFLVLNRANGTAQWSSRPAERFQTEFQVLPVELPIYDDGETS